jgi:hypothetical protein
VRQLVSAIWQKAKVLENSSGMRRGFQSFTVAHNLSPDSVRSIPQALDFTEAREYEGVC